MNDATRPLEPVGDITKRLGFPAQAVEPNHSKAEIVVTRLSDVQPRKLEWLWQNHIPAGMTTILEGDPGLGKSTLTIDLIARVTRGWPMPGEPPGTVHEPRGAVLLSTEDVLDCVIVPRLIAAGADLTRVSTVKLRYDDGTTRGPVITRAEIAAIDKAIADVDAALVVVDPLVEHLPESSNANSDQDVRRALSLLAEIGQRTGATFIALRHLRKSGADNAMYRGGGSIGIIGAARAGLLVARDPQDPSGSRRILAAVKSNLGPSPRSLVFSVEPGPGGEQPVIVWHGESDLQANDLNGPIDRAEQSAIDDAKEFLLEALTDGPVLARDIESRALAAGISKASLGRAKSLLRIKSVRLAGFTGPWSWRLPDTYIRNDSRTSSSSEVEDVPEDLSKYGAGLEAVESGTAALPAGQARSSAGIAPASPGQSNEPSRSSAGIQPASPGQSTGPNRSSAGIAPASPGQSTGPNRSSAGIQPASPGQSNEPNRSSAGIQPASPGQSTGPNRSRRRLLPGGHQ